jgi:penicillin-binding protein 1C
VWEALAKSWRGRAALALALGAIALGLRPYPQARLNRAELASVRVVDRAGRPLYEARSAAGGYGRWVALSQVSGFVVLATLSAEDAHFRHHPGIDPAGVARAAWLNARAGRIAYGGSTITQQLAGMLDPEPRTFAGKLLEARAAVRLELTLGKDEILEQYLNRAYYGRLATGIEAASERFYGKRAAELTLDEAALLSILPRAPTAYDPARFPERAAARRAHVLAKLAERGWVDADEAKRAAGTPIELVDPRATPRARHVLDALPAEALARAAGELRTTIDLELQARLETRLREQLGDLEQRAAEQSALVVLDNRTGDVLAMIGSRDYAEVERSGAVNAALAYRPPGSTLKPFVYALALADGAHPSTPVFDVPTSWRGFRPRNASLEHLGAVSMREALASSLNVPAVRALDQARVDRFAALLGELGLGARVDAQRQGLALALGAAPVRLVDLAAAYATLARGGEHLPWRLIDPGSPPPEPRRVIEAATAFQLTDMLSDPRARRREFGVETPLELPFPVAVKTGTSKSFCDNVVVGTTPDVTVAAWVGNFDGRPMRGLLAMQGAAPLFREAMLVAMEGRPRRAFERPPELAPVELCPLSGMRRGARCPGGRHEHVRGDRPLESCNWHGPDGALRLPAELVAFGARDAQVLAGSGREIEIASPLSGARLVLDPSLPRSRQQLRLRALVRSPEVTRVRWEIDGRAIAEVAAPFFTDWAIEPGLHRVRAVAIAGRAQTPPRVLSAHEARIEVTGG